MLERHTLGNYTHPEDPGEPTTGKYRVSVTDEECLVLSWLARGLDVLEIGTGLGVSTRALLGAAEHVCTVDPDPWVAETVVPGLQEWGHLWHEPEIPEEWKRRQFHMAFIDGDHTEEAVKRDIEQCIALVRPQGLLVLHDSNYDGVKRACAALGLKPVVMPTAGWLGLVFL